jgi:hypothetical protein
MKWFNSFYPKILLYVNDLYVNDLLLLSLLFLKLGLCLYFFPSVLLSSTLLGLGAPGVFYHKQIASPVCKLSSFHRGLEPAAIEIDSLAGRDMIYVISEEREVYRSLEWRRGTSYWVEAGNRISDCRTIAPVSGLFLFKVKDKYWKLFVCIQLDGIRSIIDSFIDIRFRRKYSFLKITQSIIPMHNISECYCISIVALLFKQKWLWTTFASLSWLKLPRPIDDQNSRMWQHNLYNQFQKSTVLNV